MQERLFETDIGRVVVTPATFFVKNENGDLLGNLVKTCSGYLATKGMVEFETPHLEQVVNWLVERQISNTKKDLELVKEQLYKEFIMMETEVKKPKDEFGTRIKDYEKVETGRFLDPELPVVLRLDGNSFHNFCRGLKRPYDEGLSRAMIEVTKFLVEKLHAVVGYTQSDEISLILWVDPDSKGCLPFNGKIQKLTSLPAGWASSKLTALLPELLPDKVGQLPAFDCRIFQVPDKSEAVNSILWRVFDAEKNSISMAAQAEFSQKTLQRKSGAEKIEMLLERGVCWEDFPSFFKWGTFVQRKVFLRELSQEELSQMPEDKRPSGPVMRSCIIELDLPKLSEVSNRIEVIFDQEDPIS